MGRSLLLAILWLTALGAPARAVEIDTPRTALHPLGVTVSLQAADAESLYVRVRDVRSATLLFDGWLPLSEGHGELPHLHPPGGGLRQLEVQCGTSPSRIFEVRFLPGWVSLLPPLVAIGLAVILHQVVIALFFGVWVGAFMVAGFDPLRATLRTLDHHIVLQMQDAGHASLMLFTLLLGGMVGVVTRAGGAQGIANSVTHLATTPRRGQLATWLLGVLVFFDDYANTLVVGPTMRPITDRLRISREKLAFIVDATSAPVASVALVSSWIGVEVGYIHGQFEALQIDRDAYWVFVQTLPYRFYPFLMLFLGFLLVALGRDFGPMLRAERRARREGKLLADGATPATDFETAEMAPAPDRPQRWINAALPILVVLATVMIGLYATGLASVRALGEEESLRSIIGRADSFQALLWGSFAGGVTAILLALLQRILNLAQALQAWMLGLRSMLYALVILVLAWALGDMCKTDLHTGDYLVRILGPSLRAEFLPVLVFLVAAITSFATGTSWGTMGILFPLVVPLAHGIAPGDTHLLLGAISGILAGSVWGDHSSPVSDTTILSSLASSCDHMDHVRTQLPYAFLVALVSMLLGDLPTALGWYGPWVALALGALILTFTVLLLGRRPKDADSK